MGSWDIDIRFKTAVNDLMGGTLKASYRKISLDFAEIREAKIPPPPPPQL